MKCKVDQSVKRYKERLVEKVFTRTHGVDYKETLVSVAKIISIRIFPLLAVNFNWTPLQYDVKNVFWNGECEKYK